ncbi:MAG: YciI family protein [Bacteroidota bacterium]
MPGNKMIKRFLFLLVFFLLSIASFSQREKMMKAPDGSMQLMKKYFFCTLSRSASYHVTDTALSNKILNGHRNLMAQYHTDGTIFLSGPVEDGGDILGAYLYNVDSLEKAEEMINADPAVENGRFTYRLIAWWVKKGTILK